MQGGLSLVQILCVDNSFMEKIWLEHFGFRFDPFECLEASADPNLNRYLVEYESFVAAGGETPAFIFSPPGGGKTALRIYTGRACWSGGGGYQPFPIHYHLPRYFKNSNFSTPDDHFQQIIRSSAIALFLAFMNYPLIFIKSSPALRKQFVHFISTWIPNLDYYLKILRDTGQPDDVAMQLDRSYLLHQNPEAALLKIVYESFDKHLLEDKNPISLSIQKVFKHVMNWLLHDLGFRSVYILVDGVDGFPELAESPSFATKSLFNLFAFAPAWSKEKIFIKGFLPIEMQKHLKEQLQDQWSAFNIVELTWNDAMLAEMVRRRVYTAVDGEFNTLGKVSAIPAAQDLELELARSVHPLPREMLKLVNRLLFEYEQRWLRNPKLRKTIETQDIDGAVTWYKTEQAQIVESLSSSSKDSTQS